MEPCFEWMLVGFVGAKVVSPFVSQHSVASFIVTDIMYQKESAVQYVKVILLIIIICFYLNVV